MAEVAILDQLDAALRTPQGVGEGSFIDHNAVLAGRPRLGLCAMPHLVRFVANLLMELITLPSRLPMIARSTTRGAAAAGRHQKATSPPRHVREAGWLRPI